MARSNFNQPSTTRQQSKFAQVPSANIKRSRFDRSHGLKTSFGARQDGPFYGEIGNSLIPCFVDEVLPGDTFNMKSTAFFRLATPLHPVMDNLFVDTHFFFVPYRLVWRGFQEFMGERRNPDDDPNEKSVPQITITPPGADIGPVEPDVLYGYMGLPYVSRDGGSEGAYDVSALPFRAYRLIWNEWYRDENLQDSVPINIEDVLPDSPNHARDLLPRGKRKDYFTSALPWPQKGDPVTIPFSVDEQMGEIIVSGQGGSGFSPQTIGTQGPGEWRAPFLEAGGDDFNLAILPEDFALSNGATINDLRTAFQIQKLLERDARGGTRYTELIQSHFGVTSPDSRLQRPEYLGGGTTRVTQNPVASTADGSEGGRAVGDLGSYGTAVNQATFGKSFTEHGIIIGLVSYRADLTYQRGIDRMWSRQTRYDFFWPALAHLGEQAILNKEIHYTGGSLSEQVFGYQERYGEYRYKPSRVTGIFNSDVDESLDAWHLAQDFDIAVALNLNEEFIKELPPIERVIAVPDEPFFLADFWFDLKCDRPMPTYAVPGFVDHF